jgi:predicted dehydrogenase
MVKVGIIGCGRIAQRRHIPEYASNPNVEIVGYYNRTRSQAEDMASKYGGKVFDTIEGLLSDPEIDAVSVCTANTMHASVSIDAMRKGKHVLCEKPMATTVEDCERMIEVAKE